MSTEEPILDVAHLGHVEMLTPKPDESLKFFVEVMGLTESAREGDSVYLRGWDDYEHHTLKLTGYKHSGLGHFAYRARSPQALERRVAAIEEAGRGSGWTEGDIGHGPAYAFTTPDGHNMEIYYETEWYSPPAEERPALKNQAARDSRGGARTCDGWTMSICWPWTWQAAASSCRTPSAAASPSTWSSTMGRKRVCG